MKSITRPYWQYFTGETWLQTELPIDPSSLTRWRKRIGEKGVGTLLMLTIDAARKAGAIRNNDDYSALNLQRQPIPASAT